MAQQNKPNAWQRYKKGVQAKADAKNASKPSSAESDDLRRRQQKEDQARVKTGTGGSNGKKPVVFKKYGVNKVFIIGHHWSWVLFKDWVFWLISVFSVISTIVYPFTTESFEPSVQYFMLLVILPVVIWWRIKLWQKDYWEMNMSDGALRDVKSDWHLMGKNSRVTGGRSGLASWEPKEPFPAWILGRVGHVELEAIEGKENGLEGIKYPSLIDHILACWRNGESPEKIEELFKEWKAKKTPIERFVGWFFGLVRSSTRTKHTTARNPVQRRKQTVMRSDEIPDGEIIEVDNRTAVRWEMYTGQPVNPVTPCGLKVCREFIGGRIEEKPVYALRIKVAEVWKMFYFHSFSHFDKAVRRIRQQRDPNLNGFDFLMNMKFVEN